MTRLERRGGVGRRRADTELLGTRDALTAVLDRLGQGIVIVDASGRVRFANRMAHGLIADGDALRIRGGVLSGTTVPDAVLLSKAIKGASDGSTEYTLHLRRTSGKRPLFVFIAPGGGCAGARRQDVRYALVLVSDAASAVLPPKERLTEAYGFTATESTLARLLMQGVDLAAAASSMRIQMATVRTHLRGLLTKTQTHRQADLVRVLLQEIGPMV
jgi:DNA-binding CsgD family transcriptional regulator